MVLSTDWTQLEVIDLINDGSGLGFGIIGGRSTGVVVKTVLPGGIADQDGHLRTGDHILQIGDVNVRGMGSEQVALVLRQSGPHVRLVVARSVLEAPQYQIPHAPIIPTHQLEQHMEHFNAVMAMETEEHDLDLHNLHLQHQLQQYHLQQQQLLGSVQVHPQPLEVSQDMASVDVFEVDLVKDSKGLGITIAGYVGGDNTPDEISGIFVKSVTEDGPADVDGRVRVNDQIIEVDGRSLQGCSNQQAVEVLRHTSQLVRLKLVRFHHGPKFEKLQEYLAQANQPILVQSISIQEVTPSTKVTCEQFDLHDTQTLTDDYSGEIPLDVEAAIREAWKPIVGNDFLVVVAQLAKFKEAGGLGISLEGTVDVEDGVEVRPHHYIRSILPDGPVGLNGILKSSDELLEVNGKRLLGLNHVSVVDILKDLPQHVRLVCARRKTPLPDSFLQPELIASPVACRPGVQPLAHWSDRLVKAKSEATLPISELPVADSLNKPRSRSLEPMTSLAIWSSQPVVIELDKGDRGLGFSILDYQNPVNPKETIIIIRSLVPGGVAQLDGRLVPGDRLMSVNNVNVEHASLAQAVQALKAAGRGSVKIGVTKPLPVTEVFKKSSMEPRRPVQVESPPSAVKAPTPPLTPPLRPAPCSPKRNNKLQGRSAIKHRKTSSTSPPEHLTSSDLTTPPGSPRPLYSGHYASPELARVSAHLERTIVIHKCNMHLGLAVENVDNGVNGCVVKDISKPSCVHHDGRICHGDYIVAINNESLRRVTHAQARAILRRSSLIGSDITITYIPGHAVDKCQPADSRGQSSQEGPKKLGQPGKSDVTAVSITTEMPQATPATEVPLARQASTTDGKPGIISGQKTLQTDGSFAVGNQMWGPPRPVQLIRDPGQSLGISIVGGRVDMFNVSQEHSNAGIFIKQVLAGSPAGRNGTLKKGDRILEVNGCDVRNATHDEAVEVIRNSTCPITFIVQSLSYSSCPKDPETSPSKTLPSVKESAEDNQSCTTSSPEHMQQVQLADTMMAFPDSESEDEFGYTKKRIQKKYLDLPGTVHLLDVNRGNNGIGIGLAGNKDRSKMSVFVAGVQPDSPAARDGKIQVGDEILEVNGISLHGLSHLNASAVIKGVSNTVVKLLIHRREDFLEHMAVKPLRYCSSPHFDSAPPLSPRGSADTTSSCNSHQESSATTYSHSSGAPGIATTPSSAHSLMLTDNIQIITLHKPNSQGLGFGISEETKHGRHGIFVISITCGGVADKGQQLEVGDEILEAGDKSFVGLPYDKAIEFLRSAQGSVRLKVHKANPVNSFVSATATSLDNAQEKMQFLNTLGESSTDPMDTSESVDPRTCPIAPSRSTNIEIEKGKMTLGLGIVGGSDTLLHAIIIREVYEGGAASKDGRLRCGDQILEVNGEDVTHATHVHALQVLSQTPSHFKLTVYRSESRTQDEANLDIILVDLVRRPGKGLGLSIMGRKNGAGIYISDIVKGGVAEADERLMHGDQIVAVNGEDLRNATHEYAASVLKTSTGKVSLSIGRLKASSKTSSRNSSNHGTSMKKSDSSASSKLKSRHSKSIPSSKSY